MRLYRLRIRPTSPWRTPWQSDTLFGMLCWAAARTEGDEYVRQRIVEPTLEGRPPFVLSDAFPDGLMPLPPWLRLRRWTGEQRPAVRRARFLSIDDFERTRRGEIPPFEAMLADTYFRRERRMHSGAAAELYATEDMDLVQGDGSLWIYFRVAPEFAERLMGLFETMSESGFGADVSSGRGQFEVVGEAEPASFLDSPPADTNGLIVLSTFQPAAGEATTGLWESFTKFGKLGPDFGLQDELAQKRGLVLLRAGACFLTERFRPVVGRAIPMSELLAPAAAAELAGAGCR